MLNGIKLYRCGIVMFILIFMSLPLTVHGQLDTVEVYPGLSISYLSRGDTVMISVRKFNNMLSMFRSQSVNDSLCMSINSEYSRLNTISDMITKEAISISHIYKDRSIMYERMYTDAFNNVLTLNTMIKDCGKLGIKEKKRSWRQGAIIGTLGGIIAGVITTVIILN